MKRFMSLWAALPMLGCGDSFFITINLDLDTQDAALYALDPAEVREIEVLATPNNGDAPVTFIIEGVPRFPPEGFISYALELPKELENVPLQLVHRALPVDPSVTEPFLFATTSVTTEPNFQTGVLLSAKDPACNNVPDGGEFCFGFPAKGDVTAQYTKIFATNVLAPAGPIIMAASDNIHNVLAFSASPSGLQQITNLGFPYPNTLSSITDVTLLDSDNTNQFVSVALLQDNQIFIRFPNGLEGPDFSANNSKKIVSAELSPLQGKDLAAITDNSVQVFLNNAGVGFDAPIAFPVAAGLGSPNLLKARKANPLDQFSVVTQGASHLLTFVFDPIGNSIRQLAAVPLLPGSQIVSMALVDLNADGTEDAVLADNGPNKRLLILLLNGDGSVIGAQSEIPLSGNQLSEVAVGRFDNNASLDFAVSGERGQNFVQFILSSDSGAKVTAPRAVAGGAGTMLPVKLNTQNQADTVLVETTQVNTIDILVPEL